MYTVNTQIVGPCTGKASEALAWLDVRAGAETEYVAELWRLCGLVGLDAAVLFAQWAHETGDGSSPWWIHRRNPAGIGITGDPEQNDASHTWANGTEAAQAHIVHMIQYVYVVPPAHAWDVEQDYEHLDPRKDAVTEAGYLGTVRTINDLTGKWATDTEYAQGIVRKLNAIFQNRTEVKPVTIYQIVGLPGPGIELPVPLAHQIIGLDQPNQMPGIPLTKPYYWVMHETANPAPGANAQMHSNWLHNGADGSQVSFHFCVDDGQIIQLLPIDTVSWQATDGAGPGNMSGISCELCVNAGIDTNKARHNAEQLCAGIMKTLGLGIDRVKAHYDFNEGTADRHHCPDTMLNDGYWPVTFKANVAAIMHTSTPTPEPVKPYPITWKRGDVGPQKLNNYPATAFLFPLTAKKLVNRHIGASAKAPRYGKPIHQGEKVTAIGTVVVPVGAGLRQWYVLDDLSRVIASSFEERLPKP